MPDPEFDAPPLPRVLVVDDCPDAADSLALLAELWGYDVQVAYSGADALLAVALFRPRVVLLDLDLGKGPDGYAVVRQVRQQAPPDEVLLVAVTGFAGEAHHRRCLEAGFDHFLVKPYPPEELERLLAGPVVAR